MALTDGARTMFYDALAAQLERDEALEIAALVESQLSVRDVWRACRAIPFSYDPELKHIRFGCPKWMEPVRDRLCATYPGEVAERKLQQILWRVAIRALERFEGPDAPTA